MNIIISRMHYSIYKISPLQFATVNWSEVPFFSLTKTPREISVLGQSALFREPVAEENGWRMCYINGTISFQSTGILVSVLVPLAARKISILAVSTFDTDYVFFKESHLNAVQMSLQEAGFSVIRES